MTTSYRSVNEALPALADELLHQFDDVPSRAGLTKELTFQHFTIRNPLEREIIVPGRKANLAAQIAETAWILAGRNDVEWLAHYLPRAAEFSDDGETWRAGYGPRLRNWGNWTWDERSGVDQLTEVIRLLKSDPTTRRAVMSIWDPAVDYAESKDIPCNNWLHFLARDGVLSLHVATRSNDLVWGWSGINQFEWSVLLEIVAAYAGLEVGAIHYAVSSLHMYDRHWAKAADWQPASMHETKFTPRFRAITDLDTLLTDWFRLEGKIRSGVSRYNEIAAFPEPMLRSWLELLAWWWSSEDAYLSELHGTRLRRAAELGVQPKRTAPSGAELAAPFEGIRWGDQQQAGSEFIEAAIALHNEKHTAYGDSWKRRGEMLGIMANIARKVDRLGGAETADETSADTAMDLMIYLAKYRAWLDPDAAAADENADHGANSLLRQIDIRHGMGTRVTQHDKETALRKGFDVLEEQVTERRADRSKQVDAMLVVAYWLARQRWETTDQYLGADAD